MVGREDDIKEALNLGGEDAIKEPLTLGGKDVIKEVLQLGGEDEIKPGEIDPMEEMHKHFGEDQFRNNDKVSSSRLSRSIGNPRI